MMGTQLFFYVNEDVFAHVERPTRAPRDKEKSPNEDNACREGAVTDKGEESVQLNRA